MILVDTSVWVDHLRRNRTGLGGLLDSGVVLCHPWVIGELALGHLSQRSQVLALLGGLPEATVATPPEVLALVERRGLHARGIGYVDAQLLAATLITGATLWSHDRRLTEAATHLGCASDPRGHS